MRLIAKFRGTIVLCVVPSQDLDPLHSVKWHPQQPDMVAVASDSNIYLININDARSMWQGDPIPQSELARVSQIFSVPSVRCHCFLLLADHDGVSLAYHCL